MPDTPPSVSFLPASPATRVHQPSLPAPEPEVVDEAPPISRSLSAEPTIQRAPAKPQVRATQVARPMEELPIDPERGVPYRPFTIGGLTVRCASEVPADTMLDVVSKQQLLADREMGELTAEEQLSMLHLIGQMLAGVVWPDDAEAIRQRLRDPVQPVSISTLAAAVQALWGEYNEATKVGKEQ